VIAPDIKFCPNCGSGAATNTAQSSPNIDREVERISQEAAMRAANEASRVSSSDRQTVTNGQVSPAAATSFRAYFKKHTLLQHPMTGKLRVIENGWSWSLFLFPQFAAFYKRLLPGGLIWWFLFFSGITFAYIANDPIPLAVCFALQVILAIFLANIGNEECLKGYVKAGWRIINPAHISEEQVNAIIIKDAGVKALTSAFAYFAVKGVAKVGLSTASAVVDGLHGRTASTGNPAKDVAIAERNLADAELNLRRGNGNYDKVLEARKNLAYRKQKLYR